MKKYNFFVLFFILHIQSFAQSPVIYSNENNSQLIEGDNIWVLEDKTHKLTAKDVRNSDKFKTLPKAVPNLGVSKATFWLKFKVKNNSENTNLLINLAYPNLDAIELHLFYPDTHVVEKMGKYLPYKLRKYNYPGYIFDLNIPQNTSVQVLLKINSGGQIMAPVFIGSKEAIFDTIRSESLFVGIYSGIILVMFFYNLFIYFTVRDKVYLYYVLYILIVGLVQLCLLGYTSQFFWPDSIWLAQHSVYLLSPLSGIVIIEFIKVFLRTKEFTPVLHKGFYFISAIYWIYIVLDLFNYGDELYNIIQLFAMILSVYVLIVSFKIMRKKYRPAKFLFYAWGIFLVGVFVYALKDVGILPYNNYTILMMPIGSAIETALLSFALADRIKILQKEKQESQAQALEALQEKERVIIHQNAILEQKVADRTRELSDSNKELGIAIEDLKEAQSQLVQSEKMASLGQLTAGVAHEINNPINFVSSSIKPLRRDINDLLIILNEYDTLSAENFSKKAEEIKNLKEGLDLEYVKEEIESLLKGIDEGATRTAEIVRGLRTFSRVDEADLKRVDLQEGIDSTLILLTSMMRGLIVVEKDYGKIPLVECYAGKMNQVFMNILNNAIHAVLKNDPKEGEGKIRIKTFEKDDRVCISIKDNGIGMPEEVRSKIFDPFFTTKEVGEGTGLGLSIVYNIIENHKGKIQVFSEQGEGTEFLIELPKMYTDS